MVRAILEGRKTQTRRVVKINGYPITSPEERLELSEEGLIYYSVNSMSGYYRPLYQPGDILWVRETWCNEWKYPDGFTGKYLYKADGIEVIHIDGPEKSPWRPSIYMPREAARLFLRVTDVRVERLQDITEEDARAEGVGSIENYCNASKFGHRDPDGYSITANRTMFAGLWDSINAKRGYGWDTNPWVWVIEFEMSPKGAV